MKRKARKCRVTKYFEKFKNLAYDLAHIHWFSIKSKGRVVGFEREDLIQEALLQLSLSLQNRDIDENKLLPYCYMTIKRRLINYTIYKSDMVRLPYWKHYKRHIWMKENDGKGGEHFFAYLSIDSLESQHCSSKEVEDELIYKNVKNYDEFSEYLYGLVIYAKEKFSHYFHKKMYLDIFLNLLAVKIRYNNEKDILYSLSEKYGIKEYRVWNIFRMMKKLMIEDAEIIDNLLGTSCFIQLKERRRKK